MRRRLEMLLSGVAATLLLLFTLRRWLFMVGAWLAARRQPAHADSLPPPFTPPVLLLVPLRNEADSLPPLLDALTRLDYPAKYLTVVFVDDGSTDDSRTLLQRCIAEFSHWHLLPLSHNVGKAAALNAALAQFSAGDIIAIYDADERPRPDALRQLVQPFTRQAVGAVSGRRAVSNSLASPAAGYTAIEGLVHQFITQQAKDYLELAPAILGANCAYRRTALAQVGNFKAGALLEDTDLTVRLALAGWQLGFTPLAVSYHQAPQTVAGYWRQHTRWARGFNEVARHQTTALLTTGGLSLRLRLELLFFSLGYLDRPALLAAAGLWLIGRWRWLGGVIALNLLTPLLQIGAALKLGRQPAAMWRQALWTPLFFGADLAMAVVGLWGTLRRAPQRWEERHRRR